MIILKKILDFKLTASRQRKLPYKRPKFSTVFIYNDLMSIPRVKTLQKV